MMKSFRRSIFFLAALLPFSLWVQNLAASVTISPETMDVGVVQPTSSTVQTITFTNTSPAPIKLLSAETSCTMCTHVTFVPSTLEAGKSMTVQITFTPPASEEGVIHRLVTIHTSDPKQSEIKIPVNGYVTDTAAIWPPVLLVPPHAPGSDVTSTVEIVNVSDQPLMPLYATGPVGGPKLQIGHASIPAGTRAKINLTWHLPSKPGTLNGELVLFVDHPKLTKLTLPYQAIVQVMAEPTTQSGVSELPSPATAISNPPAVAEAASGTVVSGTVSSTPNPAPVAAPTTAPSEAMVNLNLTESVPLKDFVDIVATQLKLNLIYDDNALSAPVSIRLSGPLPADALLPLLKTILQAKGLAMVPTDRPEIWRIVTGHEAQSLTEPGIAGKPTGNITGAGNVGVQGGIGGVMGGGGPGQIVTEFITPKNIDLETAASLLRGFLSPNAGQLTSVPRVNALIITDYSSQLARLHRLMDLIDKPQATAKVAVVPVKSAEPGPLADRVTKLLGQIDKTEGRTGAEKVFISPSDGGDAIVLVGPEGDLGRVTDLIKQFDTAPSLIRVDYPIPDPQRAQALDTIRQVLGSGASEKGQDGMARILTAPQRLSVLATEGQHRRIKELLTGSADAGGDAGTVQLKAYRIENRDAGEIYATLTRLLGDNRNGTLSLDLADNKPSARSPISQDGIIRVGSLPGDANHTAPPVAATPLEMHSFTPSAVNITIDQGTNTLLIAATNATHARLDKLIKQLDQKQAQVLMEVMLVSVSDSDTFNAAVDVAVRGNFAGSTIGVGTNNSGIGTGDFTTGRTPTVVPGLNAAIFNPASFSVFLSALEQTNKARVLSMPQVLALDNKPALLRSTQQQPYTSVNASTTVATTSFGGFAEAGTTLEVTPHIAPADYLNLEYRLEVSTFTGASSSAGVPPPRQSDSITSFVSVPDGSTVVLGGLRSSNNSRTVAKVPGLGDIPLLGWIGRNQGDNQSTAAFYVFVRPTILRASKFEDLKELTAEKRRETATPDDYPQTKARFIK